MARLRWLAVLSAAGWVLMAASVSGAQKVENPLYRLWADSKVGATKTMSGKFIRGDMTIETEWTDKLLEVTDDHVTIELTSASIVNGQRQEAPARKREVAAKSDKELNWHEVGQEDVKAMGRTFRCKVATAKIPLPGRPGQTSDAKVWVSKDVPGGVVQMQFGSTTEGPTELTFVMRDFKVK